MTIGTILFKATIVQGKIIMVSRISMGVKIKRIGREDLLVVESLLTNNAKLMLSLTNLSLKLKKLEQRLLRRLIKRLRKLNSVIESVIDLTESLHRIQLQRLKAQVW